MGSIYEKIYNKLPIPAQNVAISLFGFSITLERYGKKFKKIRRFLERSQYFTDDELKEYQREKLTKIIHHAYENVPYYRELFKANKLTPNDIRSIKDLEKVPVLTKDDIKKYYNKLIAQNIDKKKLKMGHTSGTTGSPLEILWDKNIVLMTNAVLWRQRNWSGLEFGDKFATFFGRVSVPISQKTPPFWRYNFAHNQLLFSSFHLTKDNLIAYFDKMAKFSPKAIEGYPSNLFILAKFLKETNRKFPLKLVLTTSETLHKYQRELIEESFQCKIFDYYGMAERVIFATECEEHCGHHLNSEYGITEFVDGDGNSVSAGNIGKIVATGLHNYGMPLIRYETNDASGLNFKKCACNRNLPIFNDVATKEEDIIKAPDGRYISSSALTHPFKPLHNIVESQIIQDDTNHMRIKIVKKNSYDQKDTHKLLSEMQRRVGKEMIIDIEFVDSIPREVSGKFRWVISKVPLTFK